MVYIRFNAILSRPLEPIIGCKKALFNLTCNLTYSFKIKVIAMKKLQKNANFLRIFKTFSNFLKMSRD
jgi:hypothetical protein